MAGLLGVFAGRRCKPPAGMLVHKPRMPVLIKLDCGHAAPGVVVEVAAMQQLKKQLTLVPQVHPSAPAA